MGTDRLIKIEHTNKFINVRYFLIMENKKVTVIHGNVYTIVVITSIGNENYRPRAIFILLE